MSLSGIMTKSLLSANSSMQTARVQQSAKKQMDGRAGVLDAEINLDGARGGDTKKKQEALEETKKKASALEETAINTLNTANEDMKKAGIEYAIRQISDLLEHDVRGIHLYVMNKPEGAKEIFEAVG